MSKPPRASKSLPPVATPKTEADHALFMDAVQDVKPLPPCDTVLPEKPHLKPIPLQLYQQEEEVLNDMLSCQFDPATYETGEELIYVRSGIQRRVLEKLRRGYYSVQAELDLHGLTSSEARTAVAEFLRDCVNHHWHCVRVIHGKGYGSWQKQPVLKGKVNHWLRQRDEVLAFCSARQVDGGTGAIYVLLKSRK